MRLPFFAFLVVIINAQPPCPIPCTCMDTRVDCRGSAFHRVPSNASSFITKLDLSFNNISRLPDFIFSGYRYLEELNLASNGIEYLTSEVFNGLTRLKELVLQDNNLSSVPDEALKPLEALETLRLDGNKIAFIAPSSLEKLSHVTKLWLGNNFLKQVPQDALASLYQLEALDLSGNGIVEIKNHSFTNLSQLVILALQHNRINNVENEAFVGLNNLKILELNNNQLSTIPKAISRLPSLEQLTVAYNNIQRIDDDAFTHNKHLIIVEMKKNPIQSLGHFAFSNMTKLKKLIISETKQLDDFLDLNGTVSLEILRIDRAKLKNVPSNLCSVVRKLKSLDLKSNLITDIPNLTHCHDLRLLDLSHNKIQSISGSPFRHQTNLHDLLMGFNNIKSIPVDAFSGLEKLQILDLMHNQIESIHDNAFLPLTQLEDLNLGNNRFPHLPNKGLTNVRQIKTFNNKFLKEFPPPASFPHVHSLVLSYAYHCCEFLPLDQTSNNQPLDINEMIIWPPKDKLPDLSLWNSNNSDIWPGFDNLTARFGEFADDIWGNFGPDYTYPSNLPQLIEEYFEDYRSQHVTGTDRTGGHNVHCIPQPGPFMPCEDLFDWWTLRCGVWIVFLLAMLGNGTVVFVLVFSRSKMDVPRFLVCNLALADFFMGIYLGFLAVVDASTLGEFKMHAIKWQGSAGCQVAGFLGVLSSELSVYTLAVITLERNYAITHAMHLNKRLSLRHASYIMGCGWCFAIVISSLPLFGISDYRKFAVCLPFETEDSDWSLAYVVFLMSVNGLAFLILMGCYLKMYCAIRGSQAWNSNDSRIAKRMALLVFTDFICWAPIAFFSLTAAFGLQLISLEEAKVFTVFVLPLNSCANPFLYAILTKQFKKDCVLICKAIEESRVTRGIGRCRHSSNFSNRQTPGNTNSAVERNSSNNGQVCNCHLKNAAGGVPSGEKSKRKLPWRFSTMRYLLCDSGDTEQDSTNEYAYALAEIQRNQHIQHKRHSSVSSENFSSSRSDSWKHHQQQQRGAGHGPAARLLDKRRRNSWTITRKPSQESNLSNSRNDSSATTASTSTWRVSRSSVSSDGSAPRVARDKQQQQQLPSTELPSGSNNLQLSRFGSVRDRPTIPILQTPSAASSHPSRPKLQRQVAIDDNWPSKSISVDSNSETPIDQANVQPSHFVISSKNEDDDHYQLPLTLTSPAAENSAKKLGLSVGGFVPRKLSTISSRSCSMNREMSNNTPSTEETGTDTLPTVTSPPHLRSRSLLVIPTEPKLAPRRYASDDALQTPPVSKTAFSFDDADDDVFEDNKQALLLQSAKFCPRVLTEVTENHPLMQENT